MSKKHKLLHSLIGFTIDEVTYLEDIKKALAQGCSNPHCKADHKKEVCVVSGKCHPHAPVLVCFTDERNSAAILCSECKKPVLFLMIGSEKEGIMIIE